MTTAASKPDAVVLGTPGGWVATAVPGTAARIKTPVAGVDTEPDVNDALACPKPRVAVGWVAVYATTGETVSPPPVGLVIENATGTPPTGKPFTSLTVAIRVATP